MSGRDRGSRGRGDRGGYESRGRGGGRGRGDFPGNRGGRGGGRGGDVAVQVYSSVLLLMSNQPHIISFLGLQIIPSLLLTLKSPKSKMLSKKAFRLAGVWGASG